MTATTPPHATEQRICAATKRDGSPCGARALPDRDTCVFHSAEYAERCRQGRKRGGNNSIIGQAKRYKGPPPEVRSIALSDGEDAILEVLQALLSSALSGRLPPKQVTASVYVLNTALRCLQQRREAEGPQEPAEPLEVRITAVDSAGEIIPLRNL